ncbi:MAG: hypothetical protein ACI4OR_00370 [Alphaproteobacteria bacterium]
MSANKIISSYLSGKTAQSWIIVGPEGIGKHKIVDEVAKTLLGERAGDLSAGLKKIECGLTEEAKKAVQKAILDGQIPDEDDLGKKKSEITVEDIRSGIDFLSLKSALPCRILVISLADEMNEKAQNTLLKTLEEPYEKSLILLISKNIERLLPTIRSRCQKMFLPTLSTEEMKKQLLQRYPNQTEVDKIADISAGIPGIAKKIIENDGLSLYDSFLDLLRPLQSVSLEAVLDFSGEVAKNPIQLDLIRLFMLQFVADKAKNSSIISGYDWSEFYAQLQNKWGKMDKLYLDKEQTLAEMIFSIERRLG